AVTHYNASMRRITVVAAGLLAACAPDSAPPRARDPLPRPARRSAPIVRKVPLAISAHGHSGLAHDGPTLWSVVERDSALAIVHESIPSRLVPIPGLPPGYGLESIATLGPGRFALGSESSAEVWASEAGQRAAVIFIA